MKGLPEKVGKIVAPHDIACSLVLGAVLAVTTAGSLATVGVREVSFLAQSSHQGPIIAAVSCVVFVVAALACYALLRNAGRLLSWADARNPLAAVPLAFERRSVLIAFAVVFICWIPWMVLQFPVAMNDDTYNQLYQFQTSSPTFYSTEGTTVDASYVDHHPVFDTLLFGVFLTLGDAVGSQNAGLFVYSVFQCALIAMGLALVCCYLEKLGVPKLFRLVSLVFCALFIPLPLWAATMVKDVINAAALIFFALFVAEAVRSRGALFDSKAMVVAYIVLGCLCILSKKSGVLVVGASTVALALYLRSRWAALAAGLAVPLVVCFALVPAFVYPAIGGVAPGGKQEAFGFAFQQVITAMNDGDDLTDGEREAVAGVLDIGRAQEKYKPSIADPVKNSAIDDASTGDYLRFIPAYISIGLRHPAAYTASVFHIAGTLVTPGRTFTFFDTPEQKQSWVDTFAKADRKGELHLTFDKPEPVDSWMKQFNSAWREFVPKLGPLQLFLNVGFYGGWIPFICLVICLFNDRRYAVALVPMLAFIVIILVSPASSVRYAMPLAYTTPLTLGLLCASLRKRVEGLTPMNAKPAGGTRKTPLDRRALGFSLALGAVLAVSMWLMIDLVMFRELPKLASAAYSGAVLWGATLAVFVCGTLFGYFAMTKVPTAIGRIAGLNPLRWMPLEWNARSVALGAVVMLVFWLPYIALQFPAGMNFDTYVQIYQYLDPAPTYYDTLDVYYDAEYVDHHPVFDTLIYGTFFWVGNALGSQSLGLFACALFQTVITAVALSATCCYMFKLNVPKVFRLVSLAFCMLFPFIPLWSTTLMKDSLQAPLFAMYLICFVEAVRTRGEALCSPRWLACLIVFGCLIVLTKKTGVIVALPSLLLLLACCGKERMRALASALAVPIVCFGLFPLAVYPLVGGVHAGGTQEGLGFAMQQVMTVMMERDDLSDEERQAVSRVLDIDQAKKGYEPGNVDQVKNKTLPSATRDDFVVFLGAYASIGLRHPLEYTKSSLSIAVPYYCVGAAMTYYFAGGPSKGFLKTYASEIEKDGLVFDIHSPASDSGAADAFNGVLDTVRNSPFGRIFMARGLYGGWIPVIALFLCLYCDKRYALAFAPALLFMASLLICPVVSPRYMLGLLHVCPLLLGLACSALLAKAGSGNVDKEVLHDGGVIEGS